MSEQPRKLHIALLSLHGLIRPEGPELGRDEDTGGQVKYVLELARALTEQPEVDRVDILTRQIIDEKVGKDYGELVSPINDRAKVVRIPFGPKRYLKKERFWPYVDACVDTGLAHFRRTGIPDILHGHYADAGYVGAQLARLLGRPFVFTGHSLGRVKKKRLLDKKTFDSSKFEERYAFSARIEAEELALETASLVVTSTQQEVEQQYQLYDHYVPERMEVIPPGVDLASFRPSKPGDDDATPFVDRFLHDPDKPWIIALARLDERKNLAMLVDVYGSSPELQEKANLVLVMGARDDVTSGPPGQRRVLTHILSLIDKYDLYGKVAYPKSHPPNAVPGLYRRAATTRGVFVNPALTEPFGLTLLEAAATGLPVVATNDGGPRDILANCQHGLLVDPLSRKSIEHALLRSLTEPEQWDQWSANGIKNAPAHYSWRRHAERFVRDISEVSSTHKVNAAMHRRRPARLMPDLDRVVVADVDGILDGDESALETFRDRLSQTDARVGFGITTGRNYSDVLAA
ncbi:MAG: glycosyltransferase, partial [Myxococcota bacterium]